MSLTVLVAALCLVWLIGGPAHAIGPRKSIAQCRLDVWGAREGLPGYDITALAQTPDGYMWIGTTAGLYRFDGQTFTRFDRTTVKGLTSNLIRSLLVTRGGQLWVGTEWGGLGPLVGNRFLRVDNTTEWNCTYSLHEAPDGSILAGYIAQTKKGIGRYDNGSFSILPISSGMFATGFVEEIDGTTVASVLYDTLHTILKGQIEPYSVDRPLPNSDIRCMVRRADGSIWLGTDFDGVIQVKGAEWSRYTVANGLSSNAVTSLYEDSAHRLLIGTNNGLDVWTADGFEHITPADGLGDYHVNAIMEDREGNLWVATGKKLNRFADTALTPVYVRAGKQPVLNMASPERDGSVLCATRDGLFEQPAKPALRARILLPQSVEGASELPNGDIVCWNHDPSTANSYIIHQSHKGVWRTLGPVDFEPITVYDASGPPTFLGFYGEIQTVGSTTVQHLLDQFGNPRVFAATPDGRGNLWLGTDAGLMRVHNRYATRVDAGLPKDAHVLSIDASDPDYLWIGTDKGLDRIDLANPIMAGESYHGTIYGPRDGLPDDDLLQLLCDTGGKIWVGGYFGIFSMSKSDIRAYDLHQIRSIPFTLYTTADGVRSYPDLNIPVRTHSGQDGGGDLLWFLGQDGLTVVDPTRLATNRVLPPVVIDGATVDGQALMSGRRNIVPPGRGAFAIRFAALSFNAPEKVRYRYRLVGYDANWVDAGSQHIASYTNLPPGSYRFEVTACNNEGVWALSPSTVEFTIRPHFYQTLWFRVLSIVAFLSLTALFGRWRMRQMEQRAKELEQRVSERTVELAAANAEVTDAHDRLQERNTELQEMQAELEAQNQELLETQQTLASANERLRALATTDGLTGLINHRSFQERLEAEWARHTREKRWLSLIMLDVDNFKSYNDAYGHPAGDEVLRSVAHILREAARESDVVGRYGGEEFVIIAPNTDANQAARLGERLRTALEDAHWPLRAVTASFGISAASPELGAPGDAESVEAASGPARLIAEADTALYRSKNAGRNCVTAYSAALLKAA